MSGTLNQATDNTIQGDTGSNKAAPDGTGIIQLDPWLGDFKEPLKERFAKAKKWIETIDQTEGGLEKFSRGYEKYGFTVADNGDITYRE